MLLATFVTADKSSSRRGAKLSAAAGTRGFTPLRGDASSAPFGGTCLPAGGRSAGLTGHRRVIQYRGPPGGRLEGVRHSRGRLWGMAVGAKTPAVAEASGRGSLRAGGRRHSPFIRQRRQKAMPARIRRKSLSAIAREGFLDRRSKRCFWLLLSPQTKVARAGARNYPSRRQIMHLRCCAATPHLPPSGAPVSLRVGPRV